MILFLDFDGVLHADPHTIKFEKAPLLWKILRACPEVEVVFSTSWRELYSFDDLIHFVTFDGGEDLEHRFIGATPESVEEYGTSFSRQEVSPGF